MSRIVARTATTSNIVTFLFPWHDHHPYYCHRNVTVTTTVLFVSFLPTTSSTIIVNHFIPLLLSVPIKSSPNLLFSIFEEEKEGKQWVMLKRLRDGRERERQAVGGGGGGVENGVEVVYNYEIYAPKKQPQTRKPNPTRPCLSKTNLTRETHLAIHLLRRKQRDEIPWSVHQTPLLNLHRWLPRGICMHCAARLHKWVLNKGHVFAGSLVS